MSDADPGHATTSPKEWADWKRLIKAWGRNPACHHELARQYTRTYPSDPAGWIAFAEALITLARYDVAAQALRRARSLSKSSVRHQAIVWSTFGRLHRERGELSLAIRCYRRAVALRPMTSMLIFLGVALAMKGDLASAKLCHRRAARLATENPDEAYYNLGLILRAERRYEQAVACFDRAIEHDPKYTIARKARRDCLRALAIIRARAEASRR